ncbi:hypothetical protein RB595_005648 [Gaeumannomyces hyphopodioides]
MPSVLGKRKSRSHEVNGATKADTHQDAQDIFRRLFEQRFTPLEPAAPTRRPKHAAPTTAHDDDDDDTDEDGLDSEEDSDEDETDLDEDEAGSEWSGVSDEVEVVDHSCSPLGSDAAPSMTKQELKAYMSSRPPSLTAEPKEQPAAQGRKAKNKAATAEDSADLLANDLALQRLLSESHLLSAAAGHASSSAMLLSSVAAPPAAGSAASSAAFAQGRLRRRTADLRMQALGSRESVFAQPAMPLAIRRGIAQHRAARDARRRREARECGVVLEAPSSSSSSLSSSAKRRAGGGGGARRGGPAVGMPGVGRMRGAELRISAKDVRDIEGRKAGPEKRKKKRR